MSQKEHVLKKSARIFLVFLGSVLAAGSITLVAGCGGGGGYGGGGTTLPQPQPQPSVAVSPSPAVSAVPTVHLNFFGTANGVFTDPTFGAVSGFTQQQHAQVLGLDPGVHVVITNNDTTAHTINVYAGAFPALSAVNTNAAPNGGIFGPGYQSGPLAPGQSTAMLTTMSTAGNLFIVCGFHFSMGMRDGVVIKTGATPGPQATPAPVASGTGCHGYGCS